VEIPEDLKAQAKEYHEQLSRRFRNPTITCSPSSSKGSHYVDELRAGIRKATIAQKIFPVICGSAFKNKGVQNLLDAVVTYLPSPLEVPAVSRVPKSLNPTKIVERSASDSEPFSAARFSRS
jgi:elongation factor G